MFNQGVFIGGTFAADTFLGSPEVGAEVNVVTTWVFSGSPYASQSLDYIVKSSDNIIIAYGTASTDGSGVLTVSIDAAYSGQKVLVHVENVSSDMSTTGKVHGTQVVTAA